MLLFRARVVIPLLFQGLEVVGVLQVLFSQLQVEVHQWEVKENLLVQQEECPSKDSSQETSLTKHRLQL